VTLHVCDGSHFFVHHVGEENECTTFAAVHPFPLCLTGVKIYENPGGFASYTWW